LQSIAEGAKELSVIGLGYVEKEGEAIACVLLSASHPMPIALPLSKDLVPYLVEELIKIDYRVLGVNSSSEIASYFAQLWKEKTNVQMEREATIRLYSLKEVTLDANAQNVEGELIQCTMNDFDLIKSWMKLFEVQTGRKVHPNEDGFNSLIKSRYSHHLNFNCCSLPIRSLTRHYPSSSFLITFYLPILKLLDLNQDSSTCGK
jgi:hypothetical protein